MRPPHNHSRKLCTRISSSNAASTDSVHGLIQTRWLLSPLPDEVDCVSLSDASLAIQPTSESHAFPCRVSRRCSSTRTPRSSARGSQGRTELFTPSRCSESHTGTRTGTHTGTHTDACISLLPNCGALLYEFCRPTRSAAYETICTVHACLKILICHQGR